MTTDLRAAKAARKPEDPVWSFDFRTHICYGNDSDDSDHPDTSQSLPPISSEAKLLRELDLSTREETVTYKPNPFSIAKTNAAYRSNAPRKKAVQPQNYRASQTRTTKPGQKTLLEGFEIQKRKAALPPRPPVSSPRRISPPDKLITSKHRPSAMKQLAHDMRNLPQHLASSSASQATAPSFISNTLQKLEDVTPSLNECSENQYALPEKAHIPADDHMYHELGSWSDISLAAKLTTLIACFIAQILIQAFTKLNRPSRNLRIMSCSDGNQLPLFLRLLLRHHVVLHRGVTMKLKRHLLHIFLHPSDRRHHLTRVFHLSQPTIRRNPLGLISRSTFIVTHSDRRRLSSRFTSVLRALCQSRLNDRLKGQ